MCIETTYSFSGKIATLCFTEEDSLKISDCKTRLFEHRLNLGTVSQLNKALDEVLENKTTSALIVTAKGKFFCNGLDLNWVSQNIELSGTLQHEVEKLLARILIFPIPTICLVNGHCCAAGAMLALSFDYRLAIEGNSLFFIPGVDLNLVYSAGMTELIKAKTPVHMHRDVLLFAKRYSIGDLFGEKVVTAVLSEDDALIKCIDFIRNDILREDTFGDRRFATEKYRQTLEKIKIATYENAFNLLSRPKENMEGMGFEDGKWSSTGQVIKNKL
eukprot:snap_masked-scaffold_49-processed-gene-0.26-mRNA-1 protein AED:0.02 eAED:0.02 QI:0/-1/0/1/-1/1/1/0/272